MHTDGEDLLRAVLRAPEDDAPRLALADWLMEHPDQIELCIKGLLTLLVLNGWRPIPTTVEPPSLPRHRWPAGLPRPAPG